MRLRLATFLLIAGLFAIAAGAAGFCWGFSGDGLLSVFDKLRGPLFAGFLTLGGFLLSLNTFVVVNIKTGLYDNEHYREAHDKMRLLSPKLQLFDPLKNLKSLLLLAIVASLITAVLQVSVGLVSSNWAALACFSASAFTVGLLLASLYEINVSLNRWFQHLEKAEKKRQEDLAAAKAADC